MPFASTSSIPSQIEGARLQAKGLGQTKPVGSNETPEGRQNNRRVELVKS